MNATKNVDQLLRDELAKSQLKNPSFSLRAFAKRLSLSPSVLSEVLNGRRKITHKLAVRVLDKLMIAPEERPVYLGVPVKKSGEKSGEISDRTPAPIQRTLLDTDRFRAISEWQHFAILSLLETRDASLDATWISKRLRISKVAAHSALERLIRLGFIECRSAGRGATKSFRLTSPSYTTTDENVDLSIRKGHAQNLELARQSLDRDSLSQRDFTAITMAIAPERMPEAKALIRKFRDELCALLQQGETREVYKMCVQLFPLTDLEKSN